MTSKTYHIYLEDKCLFKNLNESEFDIIWSKLIHILLERITYSCVTDTPKDFGKYIEESSY